MIQMYNSRVVLYFEGGCIALFYTAASIVAPLLNFMVWSVTVCNLMRRKEEFEARVANANVDVLMLQET